jgi:hypothetical protein
MDLKLNEYIERSKFGSSQKSPKTSAFNSLRTSKADFFKTNSNLLETDSKNYTESPYMNIKYSTFDKRYKSINYNSKTESRNSTI